MVFLIQSYKNINKRKLYLFLGLFSFLQFLFGFVVVVVVTSLSSIFKTKQAMSFNELCELKCDLVYKKPQQSR
jgi:hypothetical protein